LLTRGGELYILGYRGTSTLALLGALTLAYPVIIPWANSTSTSNVFPPDSKPYGFALGEWSAKSWQRTFSMPSASDGQPIGKDADNSCAINQSGPVWYLEGSGGQGGVVKQICTIPEGKAVLITLLTGMCSYADTPSAKSDSELQSCAMAGDEGAIIEMSIDGVKVQDINTYRVQSQQFDLTIAEQNPFGVRPGPTRAVSDCWCVMVEPLPVGRHMIQYTVSIVGNPTIGMSSFATEVTYDLIVQKQQFAITPYAVSLASSEDEIILPINSSSNVSEFRFNEQLRQISFKVSSEDNDGDIVIIPISRALEDPYTVTFDGNITTDYEIINNHTNNETSIKISHNQGIHDITVTGTSVIPEFPSSLVSVLILGVAIGVIVNLSRMHYNTPK
jgi:hypothetical protein